MTYQAEQVEVVLDQLNRYLVSHPGEFILTSLGVPRSSERTLKLGVISRSAELLRARGAEQYRPLGYLLDTPDQMIHQGPAREDYSGIPEKEPGPIKILSTDVTLELQPPRPNLFRGYTRFDALYNKRALIVAGDDNVIRWLLNQARFGDLSPNELEFAHQQERELQELEREPCQPLKRYKDPDLLIIFQYMQRNIRADFVLPWEIGKVIHERSTQLRKERAQLEQKYLYSSNEVRLSLKNQVRPLESLLSMFNSI